MFSMGTSFFVSVCVCGGGGVEKRVFWFLELTIPKGWGGSRLICQVWAHLVTS